MFGLVGPSTSAFLQQSLPANTNAVSTLSKYWLGMWLVLHRTREHINQVYIVMPSEKGKETTRNEKEKNEETTPLLKVWREFHKKHGNIPSRPNKRGQI